MTAGRVVAPAEASARAREWKRQGDRVGIAVGSFDLLSAAHARSLAAARSGCGRLIVLVRDDAAASLRLGAGRPVIEAAERARIVAALRGVDLVVVTGEEEARGLSRALVAGDAGAGDGGSGSQGDRVETDPALPAPMGRKNSNPDLVARVRDRAERGG